jgi:hypothetical protein
MSDAQNTKPIPKEYPRGFSFWETVEIGNLIDLACEETGINPSNWLRQTVRWRLRHEGWIAPKPRTMQQPTSGNRPNA